MMKPVEFRANRLRRCRSAFTLTELLVVLAIIGLLVALFLPAVQRVRESGRRTTCANNIRQIGLATIAYHDAVGAMPVDPELFDSYGNSFLVSILPFLGEQSRYDRYIDIRQSSGSSFPQEKMKDLGVPSIFLCPTDAWNYPRKNGKNGLVEYRVPANYVASTGSWFVNNHMGKNKCDGAMDLISIFPKTSPYRGPSVRFSDFSDGLSNTAMVSEALVSGTLYEPEDCRRWIFNSARKQTMDEFEQAILEDCEARLRYGVQGAVGMNWRCIKWWDGTTMYTTYNHLMRPNTTSSTWDGDVFRGAYCAASDHPGVVNVVFADGHFRSVSDQIDKYVWRALGSRNGNETVGEF